MQKRERLQNLDEYFPDHVQIQAFIILGFDEAVQIQTEHFSDDADMASKLEITFDLDDIFVDWRVISGYL